MNLLVCIGVAVMNKKTCWVYGSCLCLYPWHWLNRGNWAALVHGVTCFVCMLKCLMLNFFAVCGQGFSSVDFFANQESKAQKCYLAR